MIRTALFLLIAAVAVLFFQSPSMAQETRKEVQARIESRFAKLEAYRDEGKIGEVVDGSLQPVEDKYMSDATLKGLVDAENADRKTLFAIIAKEEGAPVEEVAKTYARKLFDLAKPQHFLKGKNGKWIRKSDVGKK